MGRLTQNKHAPDSLVATVAEVQNDGGASVLTAIH